MTEQQGYGQAQARIAYPGQQGFAQSLAYIREQPVGLALSLIDSPIKNALGQAQALLCLYEPFTYSTDFGLGPDFTWIDTDSSFDVPEDSTYFVDGSKVTDNIPTQYNTDSYKINRDIPTKGLASFEFTTNSVFTDFPYIAIVFAESDYDAVLSFGIYANAFGEEWYLTGAWSDSFTGDDLLVDIQPSTTYRVQAVYDETGKMNIKVWDINDPEPDYQLFGYVADPHFMVSNRAWIDLYLTPDVVSFDNLLFCSGDEPVLQFSGSGQAQAFIYRSEGYAQAQANITNTTANGFAQAYINWDETNFPFQDNFTRITQSGLGSSAYLWQEGLSSVDHPAESEIYVNGTEVVIPPNSRDAYRLRATTVGKTGRVLFVVRFPSTVIDTPEISVTFNSSPSPLVFRLFSQGLYFFNVFKGSLQLGGGGFFPEAGTFMFECSWTELIVRWRVTFPAGNESGATFGTQGGINTEGATNPLIKLVGGSTETVYLSQLLIDDKTYAHAQARAKIKAIGINKSAQALAKIKSIGQGYAQAQAYVYEINQEFGQAQALIAASVQNVSGQALATIAAYDINSFGQAQTRIKQTNTKSAQARGHIVVRGVQGYSQAQATIILNRIGQAQAKILATSSKFAQAQARIKQTYQGYGQAQAQANFWFKPAQALATIGTFGRGQAQAFISHIRVSQVVAETIVISASDLRTSQVVAEAMIPNFTMRFGVAQAAAEIIPTFQLAFGQAQATTTVIVVAVGQAQADIVAVYSGVAQAQAQMLAFDYPQVGQAQARIILIQSGYGQAAALIPTVRVFGQAQAFIFARVYQSGQAQAKLNRFDNPEHGQAQAEIKQTYNGYGQAAGTTLFIGVGQAVADILQTYQSYAQALALIVTTVRAYGQAQTFIKHRTRPTGMAQAFIKQLIYRSYAQAQADVKALTSKHGQARAFIISPVTRRASGQAQAFLNRYFGWGQAQAQMLAFDVNKYGQAQAKLRRFGQPQFAQALAMRADRSWHGGQALAQISKPYWSLGQARAVIVIPGTYGQAQAFITPTVRNSGYAQAQAYTVGNILRFGQARAKIARTIGYAHAQAMIFTNQPGTSIDTLPPPGALVKYNGYTLPGYLQSVETSSPLRMYLVSEPYEIRYAETIGLENKELNLRLLVINHTYQQAKAEILRAGTFLRSNRSGWSKLTVNSSKYYLAQASQLTASQSAGKKENAAEYGVRFHVKPWLYGVNHIITGTTLLDTNDVGRDLTNGTWTYAKVTLTGENITVSGYTDDGEFTGFASIDGPVDSFVIDSEAYTSTDDTVFNNYDYQLRVAPGRTKFAVTGATEVTIEYEDRWSL